ncbi:ATP-binding SpoIIE family protein phosphatase [Desulfocurvus sp. DL9XJH121]
MQRRRESEPIRVLVVDDEESIRESLREMLMDFAYDVACASDGREAIAAYEAYGPDIVLLDMNMPRMGGLGVIRHLREVVGDADVLITMLTSDRSPENKLSAFGAGANDFLYKPFDRAELLARVGVGARQVRLNNRLRRALDSMDRELALVAELQAKLLPEAESRPVSWPHMPGVRVQSVYRPSGRASGDYFDYFPVREGVLRAVVADVSGHGARAAFLMSIVRTLFRVTRSHFMGLEETFRLINGHLCDIIRAEEDFVTALAVDLDFRRGHMNYINAGHCPGLLKRGCEVAELGPTGTVLGFFETVYAQRTLDLSEDGGLFMYTDGFYDWKSARGGLFGFDRFRELADAALCGDGDVPGRLMDDLRREEGGEPAFRDDVTALWIAFGGSLEYSCRSVAACGKVRALAGRAMAGIRARIADPEVLYDLELAVTEALSNVARHAYPEGGEGEMEARVRMEPGRSVRVEVRDRGRGFDLPRGELRAPDPAEECGRGVFILSRVADRFSVEREDGATVVRFEKDIGKEAWKI